MPHCLASRAVALAVFLVQGMLCGCGQSESGQAQPAAKKAQPLVPVVVAEATRKDVPVIVRAIGRVTSPATVSMKPQVTGSIAEVHFKDGEPVKTGALLFTIDRRPFQVALEQARATLSEAKTRADNAAEQAQRYTSVAKTGGVSQDEVAGYRATAKAAAAAAMVAEAAARAAELQLAYCTMQSPIDGRTGKALVTAGNVVTANQTELVIINQIAPVEVSFNVAEQQLAGVQEAMRQGVPKVIARLPGPVRREVEGELTFVDNAVRANTGTVELHAGFSNEPQVLWPGQFVGVRVQVGLDKDALVVPAAAVQSGQESSFVFVVSQDRTVDLRPVEVSRTADDETLIQKGLESGEMVVVDGQSRLTGGAKVRVVPPEEAPMPPAQREPGPPAPPAQVDAKAAAIPTGSGQ